MTSKPQPPAEGGGLYDAGFEHDACGVGFVADLGGRASHALVSDALGALERMEHRGAYGAEPDTGDGAGILIRTPLAFFRERAEECHVHLPAKGSFAVGLVFLSKQPGACARAMLMLAASLEGEGVSLAGTRDVPTDASALGKTARSAEPSMHHVFVVPLHPDEDETRFERRLFVARKRFEGMCAASADPEVRSAYVVSLSSRTLVYKGMLGSTQLRRYFADLHDDRLESALAVFHARFSTNTFPSWPRAHPFRMLAHNGEINTLRGNLNWLRARESLMTSPLFEDMRTLLPIVQDGSSDSQSLDAVLELLVMGGRTLPHAMMMLVPEAWEKHETMSAAKRAFYEYHACAQEPWDGPAAIVLTDGHVIGATLDRNGLRPARYWVTRDGRVILASEVGVLDVPPADVVRKGRLEPGKMLLVSLDEGRIVPDDEVKERVAGERPYGEWLAKNRVTLDSIPPVSAPPPSETGDTLQTTEIAFGYTQDDAKHWLVPMATRGEEALGSMGTDTPLAVLSNRPQSLFDYFQQLFAQVTNPPLDAIREEVVTSLRTVIGPEGNLLDPEPESCHLVSLESPLLDNEDLARFRNLGRVGLPAVTLDITFPAVEGRMAPALEAFFAAADDVIADGARVLVLSDRSVSAERAAIPALLATAGLHHHLVRERKRNRAALVVETGEAREVHHFAALIGYGASCVNPWLALDTIGELVRAGDIEGLDAATARKRYLAAVKKGVLKVMSKMGISTIDGYRGAQIFEAIGLAREVVDRHFAGTPSRIGGIGLDGMEREALARHARAFGDRDPGARRLPVGGTLQWRQEGEYHLFNPDTVARLQHATRTGRMEIFREYSRLVDEQSEHLCTLRGLFEVAPSPGRAPVPLDEVEPVSSIVKRFATGAMSYGSISAEAHETLAIAMNRLGARSNSGEGGEDPARYEVLPNGDSRRSAVKQVASARFGVTSEYLVNADELQIKIAQGAKPGEGGQLPGHKVYPWIAKVRFATEGVGLISPPPHHDIYSIEDLAELVFDLKNANPRARVSVKLVSEVGVGTVAAGVAKAKADVILIAGHDGGTGASPLTSLKHAGAPWELGLADTQQTLVANGLRDRVVLQVDGQMRTGRDVVIGALLGAEEFGFATAPLVVMGCVMMRVCHLDTCPVGIATQNPELRARFTGRAEHVIQFFQFVAEEVREHLARLGYRRLDEIIGRADLLSTLRAVDHFKARGLDLSRVLAREAGAGPVKSGTAQQHGLEDVLDRRLIARATDALERGERVSISERVGCVDRAVGTLLGSEVTRRHGGAGLPDDTIDITLTGSAGQSLGAFVPRGITLRLEGDANDYVGKGLSGGRIVVRPPRDASFAAEDNVLIGNVALYGATSGELWARGVAGERFAVRNSGAMAVVEGIGDHGCEYMTGGRVVVLGKTGRNFGAGMSGGLAFVLDEDGTFARRCNREMIELGPVDTTDERAWLRRVVACHAELTESTLATRLLGRWEESVQRFVRVLPKDYARALAKREKAAA